LAAESAGTATSLPFVVQQAATGPSVSSSNLDFGFDYTSPLPRFFELKSHWGVETKVCYVYSVLSLYLSGSILGALIPSAERHHLQQLLSASWGHRGRSRRVPLHHLDICMWTRIPSGTLIVCVVCMFRTSTDSLLQVCIPEEACKLCLVKRMPTLSSLCTK
jgi:hypothetical protein